MEIELEIPEKNPYELNATKSQKNKLWNIGCKDQELLDSLGRDQAEKLINDIYEKHSKAEKLKQAKIKVAACLIAFALGIIGMIISAAYDSSASVYILLVVSMAGLFLLPVYAIKLSFRVWHSKQT